MDKRAEPWGKTGSREPGSVSESHGAGAPAQTEQDVLAPPPRVLAAGPPAPRPGTEREEEDRGVAQIQQCVVKTSAPSQTRDTLRV